MDVRQLEYFVAVVEELNFTRAAARCHVAQSALSYQIARLEREHGVTLLERTSRSVRVAAAGELLFHRARAVLDELDVARAELAELAGVISGRLRLGMVGSTGQAAPVVERTLAAFHQRHPAVEIAIRDTGSRHMAEQVRAGELDIAFVGLFPDQLPADLTHQILTDEPLVAAIPVGHPLSRRACRSCRPRRRERLRRDARRVRAAAAGRRCFRPGRRHPANRLRADHLGRRGPVCRPRLRPGTGAPLSGHRPA